MSRRTTLSRVLMLAVATLLLGAALSCSPAAAKDVQRPLILVHGHDAGSAVVCDDVWGDLIATYRRYGYRGPIHPVRYYRGDKACTTVPGGGSSPVVAEGSANTRIESLSASLAWWIYDRFTKRGIAVNVVAHSMGGLIIRHAVDQVQRGNPWWPPSLFVPDIVTLGTPHRGIDFGTDAGLCGFFGDSEQCRQMDTRSPLITYLAQKARDPQTWPGTWWSVAGSHADGIVPAASAVDMSVKYKLRWAATAALDHGDLQHARTAPSADGTSTACWATADGAPYDRMTAQSCLWPLLWSYQVIANLGL